MRNIIRSSFTHHPIARNAAGRQKSGMIYGMKDAADSFRPGLHSLSILNHQSSFLIPESSLKNKNSLFRESNRLAWRGSDIIPLC